MEIQEFTGPYASAETQGRWGGQAVLFGFVFIKEVSGWDQSWDLHKITENLLEGVGVIVDWFEELSLFAAFDAILLHENAHYKESEI